MANLTINGQSHYVDAEPDTPLLWVIREDLQLTRTKFGCGIAQCGASQVLSEQMTMKNGSYEQLNFDTYKTIRLRQVPEIDVELVESGHHPTGVGEPASSVVAPAVANAVFNAVGVRTHNMPISPKDVLKGMRA